jgi:hypothetical protein
MPISKRYFITAGTPPIANTSSIKNFPLGFKFASNGVASFILSISFKVKSILAVLAIPNKCNTALVEPPNATTTVNAFSKDFFERMSDGFISFSNSTFLNEQQMRHATEVPFNRNYQSLCKLIYF